MSEIKTSNYFTATEESTSERTYSLNEEISGNTDNYAK